MLSQWSQDRDRNIFMMELWNAGADRQIGEQVYLGDEKTAFYV